MSWTAFSLLASPLLWMPLLVVSLKGLFDVDVYATFDHAWLVANVVVGALFVPVAVWGARRLVGRFDGSPVLERLRREIGGRNIAASQAFLAELTRFDGSAEAG